MFGSKQSRAALLSRPGEVRGELVEELREILVCPDCGQRLSLDRQTFLCPACGKVFPIVRGVPRFVPDEGYAGNFGFEWTRHARTQLDSPTSRASEESFRLKTGFTPEVLRGKLVLDAGCGMGRYADVASRWGARVVACDLSQAVDSAYANLGDRENVAVLQADILRLPFALESFDFIYSIGVLHHTPNCEAAFRRLPALLRPGGRIAVWVYSGYNPWYRMTDLYRRVTTRLPSPLLYALCHVAVPLYYVDRWLSRLPVFRLGASVLRFFFPVNPYPDWRVRVLDTFDWYSPRYQSKHTYEEVFRWFESEGLIHNRVMGEPVAVQGQRPPIFFRPPLNRPGLQDPTEKR